jgi:hypothetical protein
MKNAFVFPQNTSGKITEQNLQHKIAGRDVLLKFCLNRPKIICFKDIFK